MWPFQRKTEAPADSGPHPVPAPVIRREWTGLPPIQRVIGGHPLTAPSDRFSDDLATHHDPSVSTEPMGHQINAEAPAGIVLTLARPTTRNDGPAMISRPRVQRSAQGAIEESGEWDGDEAASPAMRSSPLPAGMPPGAVRELPAVAAMPVMQRLTALSPDVDPMPVETIPGPSRMEPSPDLPAASRAESPDGPMAPPRLTLGQARRLGLGAPINRVPDRALQRAPANQTEMPLLESPRPQPFAAMGEGEPPRAEVAATSLSETVNTPHLELPLAPRESAHSPDFDPPRQGATEPSADPPVQRAMEISTEPPLQQAIDMSTDPPTHGGKEISAGPMPLRPTVQRIPHADTSRAGTPDISTEHEPAPETVQGTPNQPSPASGRAEFWGSPASEGGESWASPTRAGGEFWASPARAGVESWASPTRSEALELAPLVGARPLRPTTIQRSTELAPIDGHEPMSRGAGAELAGGLMERPAQLTEWPERSTLQPWAQRDDTVLPSSHGSSESMPTRSPLSPDLPRVTPPLPLQAQTQSERPLSRAAELPLAPVQRAAAEASLEPSERGAESTSEVVQRGWFDSLSSEISGLSSRAPSPAQAGSAVSTVGSAVGSIVGGHKAADTDMDELAGKLYDKIRSRLKSELLVDRERAGFLTDLR